MNTMTVDAAELLALVEASFEFDEVDFSDVQMCAKCIGECKIF